MVAHQKNTTGIALPKHTFIEGAKWQQEQEKITTDDAYNEGFENGKHWQQERSYSEEDMRKAFCAGFASNVTSSINDAFEKWFEQFKK